MHIKKRYSAIIIGSGFSGICMGIKLKEQGIDDFIILEKAADLGGTWRENTYPGAECDIPSALYSYSFEPYPYWEYKWSHQPQILEYLKHCSRKYDIFRHIHFNKKLLGAYWNKELGYWKITIGDGEVLKSTTFITAIGQLHYPSIPEFPGKDKFAGPTFHSANWNHDVDLTGKRVGVIGNAASAIQFVPQIGKIAKQVTIFQRSANWILPKQDRLYKDWEKSLVKHFPILLKLYRLRIWLLGGGLFFLMQSGNNLLRNFYQTKTVKYIKKYIKDPGLAERQIPTYPMGAKRVLFSDDYYASLGQEHIEVITEGVNHIDEKGIVTEDGIRHDLDILIYATGFRTNPFLMGLDIKGIDGISISETWKNGPVNYLGITVSGFPNMFLMYGPNTNLGHNSIIIMSEAQANYIAQGIKEIIENNWKSIDVKKDVMHAYYKNIQERLRKMIWNKIEKSWYKSSSGDIPNNWPGRTMEYMRLTKSVNFEDYYVEL